MTANYLVLKRQPSPTGDVFAAPFHGPSIAVFGTRAVKPASAGIVVSTVLPRDASAVAAHADTLAIAPIIPMQLIAPVTPTGASTPKATEVAWGLHAIGADSSPFDGAGVTVAVVDTGIDAGHPAFAGVELIQKDFTGEGIGDKHGHGTHCAGTIFGRPVNGVNIGIAPGVTKAVIAKVLNAKGSGSSESIVQGILWAIDQGAQVISMSIGMDFPGLVKDMIAQGLPPDLATSRALESYRSNTRLFDHLAGMVASGALAPQNTVIIAAAGNESRFDLDPDYAIAVAPPAVADGIVSVGALGLVDGKYSIAYFSNTGPNVSGPGVDVLSAKLGGGLTLMSGTSMATPHVAGAAALWAQKLMQSGPLSDFQLVSKLAGTANDELIAPGTKAVEYGAGMVQCPR